MNDNGNTPHLEPPPVLPWEIKLGGSVTHYQQLDGGGMALCFTPAIATPQGNMLTPPQVRIEFGKEGWENFKREVAADGAKSNIAIARQLPGEPA